MLDKRQRGVMAAMGVAFFVADVIAVRVAPVLVDRGAGGDVGLLLGIPVAIVCVLACRRIARLGGDTVLRGSALLVAVALVLHGAALRWEPGVYGGEGAAWRAGAWLLAVYGLILAAALMADTPTARITPRGTAPRSPHS